jgi:hypothetical protein
MSLNIEVCEMNTIERGGMDGWMVRMGYIDVLK